MAKRAKKQPTELELEILKVLWERGPSSPSVPAAVSCSRWT
jgi:hypothetical protein